MRRSRMVLAVVMVLVGTACAGAAREAEPGGGGQAAGTIDIDGLTANHRGNQDVSGQTSLAFELDDFFFEPTVLEGEAGQEVTLRATNVGDVAHTFTAEDISVDVVLEPGDGDDISVTFPESGAFLFVCRFHEGQGMRGALSVGGDLTLQTGSGSPGGPGRMGGYGNYGGG